MGNSFLTKEELDKIGFGCLGENVLISKFCSIYKPWEIKIGHHVRIDDFSILSGSIEIGDYIHIAAGVYLFAGDSRIILKDFSGISSQCSVYATSDDYLGGYLTNPMVPDEYRHLIKGEVVINKHVVIGTHSVVLPSVNIGKGSSIGSMSLVNRDIDSWGVYVGIPCKRIGDRDKKGLYSKEKSIEQHNF